MDARTPANEMLKKLSNIGGSNEVKAKRATPTPTTNARIPANKIAALLFLSNNNLYSLTLSEGLKQQL